MLLLSHGDVQIDALHPRVAHLLRVPIARVRAGRPRLAPYILLHLLQHPRQLMSVIGLLGEFGRHNHLRFSIHRHLRVVSLHETALVTPVRHDPTVRVRKIALRFRLRDRFLRVRYLRLAPTRLLARARLLLSPLRDFGFRRRLLLLRFLLGFCFQLRLGGTNLGDSTFSPRQLRRQLFPAVPLSVLLVLRRIHRVCSPQ
jgi:hypothetical protein